mgnify:FL=1
MEAVYEAKTKHTDEMIKQYVKFQNNVNTPTKKLQSVLIAMCVLALMLLVPQKNFHALCIAITALILLNAMLGDFFTASYLKREDENYKRQNDILYHFGNSGFSMENPADKESLRFTYQDIRAMYQDEKFWYLCMKGGELHMVGKGDVLNYDGRFGIFLEKQSGLKLKNAKTTVLERIQIMQGRKKSLEEDKKKRPRKGILP